MQKCNHVHVVPMNLGFSGFTFKTHHVLSNLIHRFQGHYYCGSLFFFTHIHLLLVTVLLTNVSLYVAVIQFVFVLNLYNIAQACSVSHCQGWLGNLNRTNPTFNVISDSLTVPTMMSWMKSGKEGVVDGHVFDQIDIVHIRFLSNTHISVIEPLSLPQCNIECMILAHIQNVMKTVLLQFVT